MGQVPWSAVPSTVLASPGQQDRHTVRPWALPGRHIAAAVVTVLPGTAQPADKAAQQQGEQKPATNERWTLMYSQASKAPDKHLPINS